MTMKVGDTFFFEGVEFSIKNIDKEMTEKFPTGRVDASKFIGTHDDIDNPRTIQRGRPKMFSFSDVAEALGESLPTSEVTSDIEMTEATSNAWSDVRTIVSDTSTPNTTTTTTPFTW